MFRYEWIWEKNYTTGHMRASYRPLNNHENLVVFYKKQPTYNPQGIVESNKKIKQKLTTLSNSVYKDNCFKDTEEYIQKYTNYPRTIQKIGLPRNSGGNKSLHPTQKPVLLMEYLIKTYTNEDDLVLDNCMGSGSTGVACGNLNRRFIGIELNPEFFKIAENRIKQSYNNISNIIFE